MDVAHGERMQWAAVGRGHRAGGVMFKTLFVGCPGPGNYWLTLVHVDDYSAPAHRHNFDQVRLMLEGAFNFGAMDQPEGTIGYFSAGTEYTQRAVERNVHLLLQSEAPDGARYLSQSEIEVTTDDLKSSGSFSNGRYLPAAPGAPSQDGFEAVWERASGRKVEYRQPRYSGAVIMHPDQFRYRPIDEGGEAQIKTLGSFSEDSLGLTYLSIAANGRAILEAPEGLRFIVAIRGRGVVQQGDQREEWERYSAFRLAIGAGIELAADKDSEFCIIDLAEKFLQKAVV